MKEFFQVLTLLLALCDLSFGKNNPNIELFSEGFYLSRDDQFGQSLFARAFSSLSTSVIPYLQMGGQKTYGKTSQEDVYVSPGVLWDQDAFKLYGEHRYHPLAAAQAIHEWRCLILAGFRERIYGFQGSSLSLFIEPYTEAIVSSDEVLGELLNGFVRVGLNLGLNQKSYLDIYLEPNFSLHQRARELFKQVDIRPGIRFSTCPENVCFHLLLARPLTLVGSENTGILMIASLGGSV